MSSKNLDSKNRPISNKKSETRKKLLQTTLELLEQEQGAGVRMADIARSAGVSRQTLYLHFDSRSDLLIAVTRYVDDQLDLEGRYRLVEATTNATEHLDAFIAFWGEHVPGVYRVAQALWADLDNDGAAAAAWNDRMNATRSACNAAVVNIETEGLLDSSWTVKTATDYLFSLLSIRSWALLTQDCGWTTEEYITRHQQITKRVLFR